MSWNKGSPTWQTRGMVDDEIEKLYLRVENVIINRINLVLRYGMGIGIEK